MRRRSTIKRPAPRQIQIDAAILGVLQLHPCADYRTLASAAGTSTSRVKQSMERLAARELIPPITANASELIGYANGWDSCASLMGNPDA